MKEEQVPMNALVRMTGSRIGQWFRRFREKNRPPYRWYDHDWAERGDLVASRFI